MKIEVVKSVKQNHFSTTKLTKEHERKLLPNAVDFIFLRKNHTLHEGVQATGACRFPAIYQLLFTINLIFPCVVNSGGGALSPPDCSVRRRALSRCAVLRRQVTDRGRKHG